MKLREGNVFTSVCHSVHGGSGYTWFQVPSEDVKPEGEWVYQKVGIPEEVDQVYPYPAPSRKVRTPGLISSGGHQSGQYTSYWNAFLFNIVNIPSSFCLQVRREINENKDAKEWMVSLVLKVRKFLRVQLKLLLPN